MQRQQSNLTDRQRAVLERLATGRPAAWLVVYPDGTTAVLQDDGGSCRHAAGAHAIRLPLVVPGEAIGPQ